MRRLTMLAGAFGAALLMSSGAFAQVPADPNNPNEAVPDAMAPTPYGEPITLENAKKAAAAAVAEMKKRNWQGMCIAVVGPSGDLVYFEKDDDLPICINRDFAAQGPHRRALSAPDDRVRTVARQGRLLLLSSDA